MTGICIIGLGYVGLTLAVTLAKVQKPIFGIEIDKTKVKKLSEGIPTLYEPGFNSVLMQVIKNGSFRVSDSLSNEIANQINTYIISVGTPMDESSKKAKLNHIEDSVEEVSKFLKQGDLVVIRSTVAVGTTRNIIKKMIEEKTGLVLKKDFYLSFAPERTVEGNALKELTELPQIVGAVDEESANRTANIFNKITKTVIRMSSFEAGEVVKLFDNTSRDVQIAMGNIFGQICEKLGLSSKEVIGAANYGYSRNRIFIAGAGVGGPCLVKDPYFLMEAVQNDTNTRLIRLAREINESMPYHMINLIKEIFSHMNKNINGSKILVLGFAFKGNPPTDDVRFSPTIPVLDFIKKTGASVIGYDPQVPSEKIQELGSDPINPKDVKDIDCIVVMNNNKAYLELDFQGILNNSTKPVGVVDGWQLFDPNFLRELGYHYKCIGEGQL